MQKFQKGDWVRIAKDLGPHMRHFTGDCEAIVIGSYADQYGGDNRNNYTLHLKGSGQCSWYYGHQLTLIESGRLDKLQAWEDEAEAEHKQASAAEDIAHAKLEAAIARAHGVPPTTSTTRPVASATPSSRATGAAAGVTPAAM